MSPIPATRCRRLPPRPASAFALAVAVLAGACRTTVERQPDYSPREVVELARWQVLENGEPRGFVVQLEIRDPQGPIPYYRIEDLGGRWLGHATVQGRFSRRVPFRDDEEDLGVWSMARGVAELVEASAPVTLQPMAVDADARRAPGPAR